MDVNAVQQRTREPRLIIRGAFWRPPAGLSRVGQVPAAAGVHRRDQLEPRWIAHMRIRAGNYRRAGFNGLPE